MANGFTTNVDGMVCIDKAAGATCDYPFDWTAHLAAISDSFAAVDPVSFTAPGAVIESSGISDGIPVAWVSGGVRGSTVKLTCNVKTAGGRTLVWSIYLNII